MPPDDSAGTALIPAALPSVSQMPYEAYAFRSAPIRGGIDPRAPTRRAGKRHPVPWNSIIKDCAPKLPRSWGETGLETDGPGGVQRRQPAFRIAIPERKRGGTQQSYYVEAARRAVIDISEVRQVFVTPIVMELQYRASGPLRSICDRWSGLLVVIHLRSASPSERCAALILSGGSSNSYSLRSTGIRGSCRAYVFHRAGPDKRSKSRPT